MHEDVVITYNRCDLGRDANEGFYPVRCITDGRYKLVVNLLDDDLLFDLDADPQETENRIHDPSCREIRNELHERLMERLLARGDMVTGRALRVRPWRDNSGYRFSGA